ncbi:hypothetical protein [Streptomyces sp. NPDC058374]|uniref:hypothetical protein n=1 Tax=unclassified Streptomyces TaxID=2593676 RepID=UPI0036505A8B
MAPDRGRRPTPAATPRRTLRAVALALAAGTPLLLGGAPAGAAPGATVQHCVLDLDTRHQECFDTFTDAVSTASGGRITDAPAAAVTAAQSPELRRETVALAKDEAAVRAGSVIQGTFYDDTNYGGDSFTVYGEAPCEKNDQVDYEYTFEDAWQNRISSVQPWAECWIWLYPEPGLGGDRDGPFKENTPDIGSYMNDRTRSVGFS